jgi:hypothetical protein
MSNAIVVVTATETVAPLPSTLQQSGAFISQGGTNTAPGTLTQCPTLATLTGILAAAKTLTSLFWSASVVTGTTTAIHGWNIGDTINATIAGASPSGYNGTFPITVTGTQTFTYPLASNPGSETVPGTVILADESELLQMGTTYFAGNNNPAVYVLELGESTPTNGVTALSTWITNNPGIIYSYLVPREWDGNSTFLAFLGGFNTPSSMTYFFVTTILANIDFYAALKCVLAEVESPNIAATEFSLASAFGTTLSYNPNSTNLISPLSYAPAPGTTAYPTAGTSATLAELNAANVGYIGTGTEGGIPSNILFYGQMQDGNPFNFWYSADWVQININQAISNEVINGSATTLNPLYYNQPGINRLQNRAQQVLQQAVTNGLAIGVVTSTNLDTSVFIQNYNSGLYAGFLVINAESFLDYTQENPNDYAKGKYAGLSCIYIPLRGFKQIFFNLNITNLLS